jgi:hypothetical protein
MKRIVVLVFGLVVLMAAVLLVHERPPEVETPVADGMGSQDRRVLEKVFECPEELDGEVYPGSPPPQNASTSPVVAKPSGNAPGERGEDPVPTEGKKPYYWADFASLRKEGIRNPDSGQNRAIYRELDQMHRKRLEQNSAPSKQTLGEEYK